MTDSPKCNCNDEFVTVPCPVHKPDNEFGVEGPTLVTDEHLANAEKPTVPMPPGYRFFCPKCSSASLMHYFNYCPNCGVSIAIQSKELTKHYRRTK